MKAKQPAKKIAPSAPQPGAVAPTILLVDDDESVQALVVATLEGQGYLILKAKDSDQALQISDAHPGTIDLLITDQVMPPFMSGVELAQCIRLLRPDIQVLYISGYHANDVVQDELGDSRADFLPKPFQPDLLLRKVGGMTGGNGPAPRAGTAPRDNTAQ